MQSEVGADAGHRSKGRASTRRSDSMNGCSAPALMGTWSDGMKKSGSDPRLERSSGDGVGSNLHDTFAGNVAEIARA